MSTIRHKTTEIDAKAIKTAGNDGSSLGDGILASFAAVLTTNQEDRDHDILEPSGAVIDESMPLLWQHSQSDPIGRYVETVARSAEKIVARFEVADTPLGRDTVLLLKLGILRVSIGFVPIEYESRTTKSGSGYHIKKYEIVEVSLVSVPSNDRAVILSLTTKSLESQPVKAWVEHLTTKGNGMTTATQTPPADKAGTIDTEAIATAVKSAVTEGITAAFVTLTKDANGNIVVANGGNTNTNGTKSPTPTDLLNAGGGNGTTDVRVKSVGEKYSKETHVLKHCKTGQAVKTADGREPQSVSELNAAKAGAFLKKLASKAGAPVVLREEDEALLALTYGEKWCGHVGNEYHPELDGVRAKTLLSDSVSGGTAAVPYFFDVDLISYPLLQGELFPYVDLRNVPRGNSVHGASVANPSVQWGVASGTDIPLFDTASLIAALNTNITTVTCAITVGLDFLSDSPADVGRILTENVGQRLAAECDRVTAVGNGTTEPTGIFNASGTTTVHSANNTTGPAVVSDYSGLLFGIGKQYRNPAMRCCFISNDVTYQRSRNIRVDPHPLTGGTTTVNQTPLLSDINSFNTYQSMGFPHRINTSIGNSSVAYGAMARYRMYRRLGFELRWVTEGAELARRNEAMLVVRGRFGGQPVDGNAFAVMPDAQS